MNWERLEGSWRQVTGKIKQQWGRLTADSTTETDGQHDELVGKIQEAYGITEDQAELQVKAFEEMHKDYRPTTPA